MVEEASGTRMFEERKEKAMTQMGKKDKTLAEMQSVSFRVSSLVREEPVWEMVERRLESARI